MKKQDLCFMRLKTEEIRVFITIVLFGLRGGKAIALRAMSIYFTDREQKDGGGFGLRNDSLLDGLVLDVFAAAILLNLGTDVGPYAFAKQAD